MSKQILVCSSTGCKASSSIEILERFKNLCKNTDIEVIKVGCLGLCSKGPFVIINPLRTCYGKVTLEDCDEIFASILSNSIVKRLLLIDNDGTIASKINDLSFYKKQERRVLKLCGVIDPESIDAYIKHDGYKGLGKALKTKPIDVINIVIDSNLRGRGGAGFKTGIKWKSAFDQKYDQKYIVCNADEGDPGAFMDRSILEGNPHSVIEAMIIAGYAVGASKGFIYVRTEYPGAVERLKIAIEQCYAYNLLGENVLGSGFNFHLEIRLGAGAFVCGEETALLESIEGRIGNPRGKPPYPTEKGLWGCPTVINNVETLASIPDIILKGSSWFKEVGTLNSGGTKVFALGGNITNVGLVEVPIGIKLRDIVYDIGGGVALGKKFKAVQTGGPSGGCIPESLLDIKVDYEDLKEVGSMMGSGGMIVIDDSKCMVQLARFYIDFSVSESCGKCNPCRLGNKRMKELLDKICCFEATLEDLDKLEQLALTVSKTSLCGLGQCAPNPVLSTLKYFKDEYIEHIVNKTCRASECRANKVEIISDLCKGCGLCVKVCPVEAISGTGRDKREIDQTKCIKCKACISSCPFKAIKG